MQQSFYLQITVSIEKWIFNHETHFELQNTFCFGPNGASYQNSKY